jgi:hypothetical protein
MVNVQTWAFIWFMMIEDASEVTVRDFVTAIVGTAESIDLTVL